MATKGINLRNRHVGREVEAKLFPSGTILKGVVLREERWRGSRFMNFTVDGVALAHEDSIIFN